MLPQWLFVSCVAVGYQKRFLKFTLCLFQPRNWQLYEDDILLARADLAEVESSLDSLSATRYSFLEALHPGLRLEKWKEVSAASKLLAIY
mmetsp:Transcript_3150/g.19423  ORF Transcript_3150/g.19423 Transcript_3150/m.19423 type:complete len:90 (-) Transcript_3150:327-596(-)